MAIIDRKWVQELHSNKENFIFCEICGKPLKSMGSHLASKHQIDAVMYQYMFPLAITTSLNTNKLQREQGKKKYIELLKNPKFVSKWRKIKNPRKTISKVAERRHKKLYHIEISCKQCQKKFVVSKYRYTLGNRQNAKFCSKRCEMEHRRNHFKKTSYKTKICPVCKKEFTRKLSRETQRCSYRCMGLAKTKKRIEYKCKNCGKIIFVKSWFFIKWKNHFCNRKCYNLYRKNSAIMGC